MHSTSEASVCDSEAAGCGSTLAQPLPSPPRGGERLRVGERSSGMRLRRHLRFKKVLLYVRAEPLYDRAEPLYERGEPLHEHAEPLYDPAEPLHENAFIPKFAK